VLRESASQEVLLNNLVGARWPLPPTSSNRTATASDQIPA